MPQIHRLFAGAGTLGRALRLALVPCLLARAAGAGETVTMPLDEVRAGMVGLGRTVFEGTRIDEFRVEIIGVMQNAVGPRHSMILARLEGGPLANTGMIAGMSGSPVFIDGKLIGAVAYGFPFSKQTIGGITPIAEMIGATDSASTVRAASTRFPSPFAAATLAAPRDRAARMSVFQMKLPGANMLSASAGAMGALSPVAVPLVFSGFDPATFEWASTLFAGMGFRPVLGAGSGVLPKGPLPDLAPGGALGISLIEGDMDLSATGTITHIDQGRVYAFGHPFYNLGPIQFPMKKAWVYSVFPSLYQSWKISSPAEAVGTLDQDRTTAVAGRMGAEPRMIPVAVHLRTSRGQEHDFSLRMVEDELFSPVLAYVALASVLQGNERAYGSSTIQVDARLSLSGGRAVHVEDLFTQQQPAVSAASLIAAPLAFLMSNDVEKVHIEKIEVQVTSDETIKSATLYRSWLERSGPVRAGTTLPLKLHLRSYRGEDRIETIPVTIPANVRAGSYSLLVADANAMTGIEQREMRQAFVPKDLDQLVRAINGLRRNHHLYARLYRADDGVIVGGEYLPSLPPSVLTVLGGANQGGGVVPIRNSSVWEFDLPLDIAVSGTRQLSLSIER